MNQRTSRLFRLFTALTAHARPESPRRQYQDLKRAWNATPVNQRGLVREGMLATIANVRQGIVAPAAVSS